MRTVVVSFLFLAACASGPRHVNVAHVRAEIIESIDSTTKDRKVISMGKTTHDRATVYTTLTTGGRQEETWVKQNGAWKLDAATPVAAN